MVEGARRASEGPAGCGRKERARDPKMRQGTAWLSFFLACGWAITGDVCQRREEEKVPPSLPSPSLPHQTYHAQQASGYARHCGKVLRTLLVARNQGVKGRARGRRDVGAGRLLLNRCGGRLMAGAPWLCLGGCARVACCLGPRAAGAGEVQDCCQDGHQLLTQQGACVHMPHSSSGSAHSNTPTRQGCRCTNVVFLLVGRPRR